jgi:hypothetical protein
LAGWARQPENYSQEQQAGSHGFTLKQRCSTFSPLPHSILRLSTLISVTSLSVAPSISTSIHRSKLSNGQSDSSRAHRPGTSHLRKTRCAPDPPSSPIDRRLAWKGCASSQGGSQQGTTLPPQNRIVRPMAAIAAAEHKSSRQAAKVAALGIAAHLNRHRKESSEAAARSCRLPPCCCSWVGTRPQLSWLVFSGRPRRFLAFRP